MEKQAMPKFSLEEEQELIIRAQNGDKLAQKKLRLMFNGAIQDSIKRSRVNSPNIPDGVLQNEAIKLFRNGIDNYSPDKGVKPNTFFGSYIENGLRNLESSYQNETRIQPAEAWALKSIMGTKAQLQGEGIDDPTLEQIQARLKTDYNKDFDTKYIQDTLNKQRKELSGNIAIGEDGVGENITFEELTDQSKVTVDDYMKKENDKERLNNLLSKLDDNERDLYEQLNGIGKYEGMNLKMDDIVKQKNLGSAHFAKKENQRLNAKLKGDLLK